jgi:phospholipase/carboxylesterase
MQNRRLPSRPIRIAFVVMLLVAVLYWRVAPRPMSMPLITSVDGPDPAGAAGVLVFLHGRGGSLGGAKDAAKALRNAGLPSDVSIVLFEGPYPTPFRIGHMWGGDAEAQAKSRARVRERLHALLGASGPPPARVVIAGFSQGAGVAADIAAEEPRIGGLASLSQCIMTVPRSELAKRHDLRVLVAHGNEDPVCDVNESRSLAKVLEDAGVPVEYVEFDGGHVMPPKVIDAVVTFAR